MYYLILCVKADQGYGAHYLVSTHATEASAKWGKAWMERHYSLCDFEIVKEEAK